MNWIEPKVYAVKHKNEEIRKQSRSGGIFTAVSDLFFEENGIVYGCILNNSFEAQHFRAENSVDRDRMRGSKYIQSDMGNIFNQVKEDLISGKKVLFSGTSCQVAGLKAFLQKKYDNLLCVDIVCHGVPSPLVWKKYLEWHEKKHKGICKEVDFRNKKDYGWAAHVESLKIQKKGKEIKVDCQIFKNLFLGHTILRPSCYQCPYKDIMHPADITIGDYWGIEKVAPEFNDNRGVSLVLINNDVGYTYFNKVMNDVNFIATNIEDSIQPALQLPFKEPDNRIDFWNDFYKSSFNKIAKKYGGYGIKKQLVKFVKKIRGI